MEKPLFRGNLLYNFHPECGRAFQIGPVAAGKLDQVGNVGLEIAASDFTP